jgi:hypothetical protein
MHRTAHINKILYNNVAHGKQLTPYKKAYKFKYAHTV